jgi:hypothetical protein
MLLAYRFAAHRYGASLESRRAPLKDGREDDLSAPIGTSIHAAEEKTGGARLTPNPGFERLVLDPRRRRGPTLQLVRD